MRIMLALLLGMSFSGIALFGFSVASGGPHAGCVADAFAALQGGACPAAGDPLVLVSSHVSSLQSFVGSGALALLALVIAAATLLITRFSSPPGDIGNRIIRARAVAVRPSALGKRRHWTALHEASPTVF